MSFERQLLDEMRVMPVIDAHEHLPGENRAVDICRMWLYENPKRIYNIQR